MLIPLQRSLDGQSSRYQVHVLRYHRMDSSFCTGLADGQIVVSLHNTPAILTLCLETTRWLLLPTVLAKPIFTFTSISLDSISDSRVESEGGQYLGIGV